MRGKTLTGRRRGKKEKDEKRPILLKRVILA